MQLLPCCTLLQGPGAQIDEQDSDEAPEAQPASQPVPAAAASKGAGRRAKKKGKKASKGTASAAAKDAQQAPAEEDDIDAQLKALGLVSAAAWPPWGGAVLDSRVPGCQPELQACAAYSNAEASKSAENGPASALAARSHTMHSAAWWCEEAICGCWRW